MTQDYIEGLWSERFEQQREDMLIARSMNKQQSQNIDDYPEFYYG